MRFSGSWKIIHICSTGTRTRRTQRCCLGKKVPRRHSGHPKLLEAAGADLQNEICPKRLKCSCESRRYCHKLNPTTALDKAIALGDQRIYDVLCEAGARVSDYSLFLAAQAGWDAVVTILLNKGYSPNIGLLCGLNPLSAAVRGGHSGVVTKLLTAGAHADPVREYSQTIYEDLESDGDFESDKGLGSDIPVSRPEYASLTALQVACVRDDAEIVEQLLSAGADAYAEMGFDTEFMGQEFRRTGFVISSSLWRQQNYGVSALTAAAFTGRWKIIALLKWAGADLDYMPTEHGDWIGPTTALTAALLAKQIPAIKYLLDTEAKVSVWNPSYATTLQLCLMRHELHRFIPQMLEHCEVAGIKARCAGNTYWDLGRTPLGHGNQPKEHESRQAFD